MKVQIIVNLKKSVLDPQGDTISKALRDMGYDSVGAVRQGKVFEVEIKGNKNEEIEGQIKQMCEKLLVNPVMETYKVIYP